MRAAPLPSRWAALIAVAIAALLQASCVFEKPVFPAGLTLPDASLFGVWETADANGDLQYAALFPLDGQRCLLQYPVEPDGFWFEAQALTVRGRNLLQLRILAGSGAETPPANAKNYTLVWLEASADGTISTRALGGDAVTKENLTAESARAFLEDPGSDWGKIFGAPTVFRRPPVKNR